MTARRQKSSQQLAILGGKPVSARPIPFPSWPPRSAATERKLGDVYRSGAWSFYGRNELAFEKSFAAYHDARHGIFMANGTVTLQCALAAHGIGRGDEVIVPGLTWLATAMAAHYLGAKPVFVDIEPSTLCIDPAKFEEAITPRTRAVIPVHLYGGMANLDAILRIARKHGLVVVEDCAHMQGGKWKGRGVGSWGHVGSFSFQQSKTLCAGEGGICLTNDDKTAERLYRLKHIGYAPAAIQGQASSGPPTGLSCYNFRATEFPAVILRDQLRKLQGRIERYNRNADRLAAHLEGIPGVRVQSRGRKASPQGYYSWMVLFEGKAFKEVPRELLGEALRAEGIMGVGGSYGPVYHHKLWNLRTSQYRIHDGACPVAEGAATTHAVSLSHPLLDASPSGIERMGQAFSKVARQPEALLDLKRKRG